MITYQKQPYIDEEIYAVLHPFVKKWFKANFARFSPPQKFGILPIHEHKNTLIFASTGSGKTLTAFLSIINELTFLADQGQLEERAYCIYISPLKALSRDIKINLLDPLTGIKKIAEKHGKKIDLRVEVRTGDTSASRKSRMLKKPPHILITTPESFAISITSPKFKQLLHDIDWVIVDEIHSLASSKRGTHLSLSLERLNQYTDFTRVGLSATVAPLEEVAKFLVGKFDDNTYRDCLVVDAQFTKNMDLKVLSPVDDLMTASAKKVQDKTYELINKMVQSHKTTLIFTNTRAATERVVHNLKERFPKEYTEKPGEAESKSLIGAHHGSLSAAHRLRIEKQLKNGELKCIVSSTSLELGIDIGHIDLVILLGSPKSVARAIQRIGRSGHGLHETAKGRIIVMDRDDLVECSVLLKSAVEKKIDKVSIPKNCLDVLAQQIYGFAISKKQDIDELFSTIRKSYSYATLSRTDFDSVIDYLSGEHVSLEDRYVYAKIWYDPETNMIGRKGKLARVIYMTNIGTIPDESYVKVKIGDQVIGKLDESFLERLKKGDVFVLGGETYTFNHAKGLVAFVTSSSGRPPTVPSWFSEMLPLSFDLANDISKFRYYLFQQFKYNKPKEQIIDFINDFLYVDANGANAIYEYFSQQHKFALIPHEKAIVIEHFSEDSRKAAVVHSLYGRRVNDVLSRAVAHAIGKGQHRDVEITVSDNGFMLRYDKTVNIRKALRQIATADIEKVMEAALDKTEILRRRFRHCATRALMVLRNYAGRKKSVGKQQVSSMLLLKAVRRISRNFPILKEARREVLEDLMDIENAKEVLLLINKKKIVVRESYLDFPSPFSFHLVVQGYSDIFRIEDRSAFLQRMHEKVLKSINQEAKDKKKQDLAFSYTKLWEELIEKKRKEKIEQIEYFKFVAMNRLEEPLTIREDLVKLIDGSTDIRKDTISYVMDNEENLKYEWQKEFFDFVFPKVKNLDLKTILTRQANKGIRRERLEPDISAELKRLIDGERSGFTQSFKGWLEKLLSGTIPYHWGTELVHFLKEVEDEIE